MSAENAPSSSADGSSPSRSHGPSRPLDRYERRVLGVLVEKAKTTPDAYPMSLNALTTGCNQKSNRDPQMNLSSDDVESALDRLRQLGVVAEVQGGGRVPRYRHYMYEWLGVDKVELAVVTELLLRGTQSVGELRGRAARMEPIASLPALMPVLKSLVEKGYLVALSPEGRGQLVTHNFYRLEEMEKVRRLARVTQDQSFSLSSAAALGPSADDNEDGGDEEGDSGVGLRHTQPTAAPTSSLGASHISPKPLPVSVPPSSAILPEMHTFREELENLQSENLGLRDEIAQIREELDQLRSAVDDLKTQLGV